MVPLPHARPNPSWKLLRLRLEAAGHDIPTLLTKPLFCVGLRGLFSRTIGAPGNDLNAYDDALYIVRPSKLPDTEPTVYSFNANTDPTRYGWNDHAGKYMARLKPGAYKMRRRLHGGRYWAYGQDGSPVTVERIDANGRIKVTETGDFGIDLHPGGHTTTSSEGCQTLPPESQWPEADALLRSINGAWFPYVLLEEGR